MKKKQLIKVIATMHAIIEDWSNPEFNMGVQDAEILNAVGEHCFDKCLTKKDFSLDGILKECEYPGSNLLPDNTDEKSISNKERIERIAGIVEDQYNLAVEMDKKERLKKTDENIEYTKGEFYRDTTYTPGLTTVFQNHTF